MKNVKLDYVCSPAFFDFVADKQIFENVGW